jgi:hypothetical protein
MEQGRSCLDGGSKGRRVIEKDGSDNRVVQLGASIQEKAEALRERRAPAVHLGEPLDRRLAPDWDAQVEARVEHGANLFDRVQLERDEEVAGEVSPGRPSQNAH